MLRQLARRLSTAPTVVTSRAAGPIAVLSVDDGKANAFTQPMVEQLNSALDDCTDAGAVVIVGNAKALSAGFDLNVMSDALSGRAAPSSARPHVWHPPLAAATARHAATSAGTRVCPSESSPQQRVERQRPDERPAESRERRVARPLRGVPTRLRRPRHVPTIARVLGQRRRGRVHAADTHRGGDGGGSVELDW